MSLQLPRPQVLHLRDLNTETKLVSITIQVQRKWEFRGTSDDGPILYIAMVWTDKEGDAIYAQIPRDLADEKGPLFEQGHIYEISRFRVAEARQNYRPVDGKLMIFITMFTEVKPSVEKATAFPRFVYRLTPFKNLQLLVNKNNNFIDVLGIITNISDIKFTRRANKFREIFIKDINDITVKITLWGERAMQFSINGIYSTTENTPIVALFVGCLPKSFRGCTYLTGNMACHWYFNPNVDEAKIYYDRFQSEKLELQLPSTPTKALLTNEAPILEHKSLCELQLLDPYIFLNKEFLCTVTIMEVPKQKWWYPACTKCNKASTLESTGYRCYECDWHEYKFRYKLSFVAADETATANMFCFENAAKRIIGKSCENILGSMAHSRREDNTVPPEIAAIVSLKFTFSVTITKRSYHYLDRVFQVGSVPKSYGRQQTLPQVIHKSEIGPSTPNKQPCVSVLQGSLSNALEKLSIGTPTHQKMVTRTLSFSPAYEARSPTKGTLNSRNISTPEHTPTKQSIKRVKSTIEVEEEVGHDIVGSPPKRLRHQTPVVRDTPNPTATYNEGQQIRSPDQ